MSTIIRARNLNVPGPRTLPVVGPAAAAWSYVKDPIGLASRLFGQYGPVAALSARGGTNLFWPHGGSPGTIFVYGPELIRSSRTPHERWLLSPLTGTLYPTGEAGTRSRPLKSFLVGLWGVDGAEHRAHRRLMMPAFHKQRIAAYRDDMVAVVRQELDRLLVGEVHHIHDVMLRLSLRVATGTLFGEDAERTGTSRTLRDAVDVLSQPITTLAPFDMPGLPYRRFLDLVARFDGQMRSAIARKRAAGSDDGDVLSMLIAARDEQTGLALDEDELLGHVGSIFGAAHETAASALSWTLLLLSQHPQVAADLHDELHDILGGDAPTAEQLGGLRLLDRVVNESLRLIPPAPFSWRAAAEDTELGGHHIPRYTEVFASIYHTHHMPALYPEPERFDPRRWESITPGTYEYVPFSAGPRRCIGAEFAIMEIKIALAMLLQRFRLECPPRLNVDRFGVIVTVPKNALPMIVRSPDRRFERGVGTVRGNVREMVVLP